MMGLIADLCYFAMVQVIYNNNPEIPMSAHYKLPWFVSRVSPASLTFRILKGTGWSVFNPSSPFDYGSRLLWLPAHTLSLTLITFTPTFQASVSSNITIFKHALLRNPRYHRNGSFHSIPFFFCSCLVSCLHFSTQGSPF